MSKTLLIIGRPGSGKSSSIYNLDPSTTFIISVASKSLPFRGTAKKYTPITGWDDKINNWYASDNCSQIIACINMVDKKRPDIKTLIVDDWQYMLSHEFMRRATERSFDKYNDLAQNGWHSIMALKNCRESLFTVVIGHSELDNQGFYRIKTIGKLLAEKMDFEGEFEMCLHARVVNGEYVFQTQQDSEYMARNPRDMFKEFLIPNDLVAVKDAVENYYNEEE